MNSMDVSIISTIIEKPREFKVGEKRLYLYPMTLGKHYLISLFVDSIGMNIGNIKINPYMEALRLCKERRDTVCRILAYHTFDKREELYDEKLVQERCDFLSDNVDDESLAQLFVVVMTADDINEILKHFGIDKENEWKGKALKSKNSNNSLSFGGKSVYGTLIDTACQRYGWTMRQVLWEISYANLQLLLSDSVTSVYLTDDELKKCHIPKERDIIRADDPANIAKIKAMKWD